MLPHRPCVQASSPFAPHSVKNQMSELTSLLLLLLLQISRHKAHSLQHNLRLVLRAHEVQWDRPPQAVDTQMCSSEQSHAHRTATSQRGGPGHHSSRSSFVRHFLAARERYRPLHSPSLQCSDVAREMVGSGAMQRREKPRPRETRPRVGGMPVLSRYGPPLRTVPTADWRPPTHREKEPYS